jgi:hypothetical protein
VAGVVLRFQITPLRPIVPPTAAIAEVLMTDRVMPPRAKNARISETMGSGIYPLQPIGMDDRVLPTPALFRQPRAWQRKFEDKPYPEPHPKILLLPPLLRQPILKNYGIWPIDTTELSRENHGQVRKIATMSLF